MRRLRFFAPAIGMGAAAAIAVGAGTSAQAQANATIVLGESPARACYERAAAQDFTMTALRECDHVFTISEINPEDRAATHVNRAVILQGRGELDEAVADLESALRINPSLAAAHLNLGGIHVQREEWAEAKSALDQGITLAPTTARAFDYFARAVAREELGDIPGAYADYQAAAQLAPEWEPPRLELERFQVVDEAADGAS